MCFITFTDIKLDLVALSLAAIIKQNSCNKLLIASLYLDINLLNYKNLKSLNLLIHYILVRTKLM